MNCCLHKTALLLVLAASSLASQAQQRLVMPGSDISFTSRQMGVPVTGRFGRFDADLAFDPKNPQASKVALGIDLGSVALGSKDTEAEFAKPDWLNLKLFPRATLQSTVVRATGPGRFEVAGKLSIKGTTRDVTVPVALTQAGPTTTATGAFVIKRRDYRIGVGDWDDTSLVEDNIEVRFRFVLTGVPAL